MRSIFPLLFVFALVGCSDNGVDAVKDIYDARAVFGESNAQYDARQKPASLVLPLVEEDDEYKPKLRWARYDSNEGAINIRIDVGPAPVAKLTVAEYKRPGSGAFGRRSNYWFNAVNVPAPNNAWSGKSILAPSPNVRDTLKNFDWVIDYTPAAHTGEAYSDEEGTLVGVSLHRVSLVDRKSKKVYWEKTFEGSTTKMACEPPQGGTWVLEDIHYTISLAPIESDKPSMFWRTINVVTPEGQMKSLARLTSFDAPENTVRFIMEYPSIWGQMGVHTIDWACAAPHPPGFVVTTPVR